MHEALSMSRAARTTRRVVNGAEAELGQSVRWEPYRWRPEWDLVSESTDSAMRLILASWDALHDGVKGDT